MNSRWLWKSHQRHKFLRVKAARDMLKIRVLEMAFPQVFTRYLFGQNKHKTGNNAVKMSQMYRTV